MPSTSPSMIFVERLIARLFNRTYGRYPLTRRPLYHFLTATVKEICTFPAFLYRLPSREHGCGSVQLLSVNVVRWKALLSGLGHLLYRTFTANAD